MSLVSQHITVFLLLQSLRAQIFHFQISGFFCWDFLSVFFPENIACMIPKMWKENEQQDSQIT